VLHLSLSLYFFPYLSGKWGERSKGGT